MIDINELKQLEKDTMINIEWQKKDKTIDETYRVMGVSVYSLHCMTKKMEMRIFRWDDYGTIWKTKEIMLPTTTNTTTINNIRQYDEPKIEATATDIKEKLITKTTDIISESEESHKQEDNPLAAATGKTSDSQKKAIKKYTDKFERINCRFEKGILKKIDASGYRSRNQFIVEAINEKLEPKKEKPNNIISFSTEKNKGKISKENFEILKEMILDKEIFLDKKLSSEEILNIIETNFML